MIERSVVGLNGVEAAAPSSESRDDENRARFGREYRSACAIEGAVSLTVLPGVGHTAHVERPEAVVTAVEEAIGAA